MRSTTSTVRPATALRGIVRTLAIIAGGAAAAAAADPTPVPTVYVDTGARPFISASAALANNSALLTTSGTVSMIVVWNHPVIGFETGDVTVSNPATGSAYITALTETKYLLQVPGLADGNTLQFTIAANCTGDYEGDNSGAARTSSAVNTTVYVDETAPTTPAITIPDGLATLARRPTLVGTGATQAIGAITVGISGSGPSGATTAGTATVDTNGFWAFTPAGNLAIGTWTFAVSATDAAGNASGTSTATTMYIWEAPSFDQDDDWQTTATPALSGDNTSSTLISGLTVRIQIGSSASVATTPSSATEWGYTPSTLADGTYPVIVTQIKGTNTVTTSGTLKVDANAPTAPTLATSLATDPTGRYNTSSTRPVIVVGSLETSPTQLVPLVEMNSDSSWVAMSVPASAAFTAGSGTTAYQPSVAGSLADGVYQFRATQTDAAGNTSPASATIAVRVKATVNPPTIAPLTTQDPTPTITGTAEPYASVVLRRNGVPLPTITADADGDWSYTFDTDIPDGVYSMTARQTDVGGAVSSLSGAVSLRVDTQSPSSPIILTPVNNTITADTTPTVTGSAEIGSIVNLVVNGVAQSATVAVGSSGTWTLVSTTLTAGGATHAIAATATDFAGNVSPVSVSNLITISGSTFAIALSATSGTPASGGATTALTALSLLATMTSGSATVADVTTTVFTASDFTIVPNGAATVRATKRAAPNSHIWDILLTPRITSGTMSVMIPNSAVSSPAYGVNTDSTPTPYILTIDRVRPTVQILANDPAVNATHFRAKAADGSGAAATTFSATAAFSEPVTGLAIADFAGTGATVSAIGSSTDGGMTYPITVARVGTANTLSLSVRAVTVSDTSSPANTNLASPVFTRVYDAIRPNAPVIASSIGNLTPLVPAKAPSYPCTVTFSEPVVGFTKDDLEVTNGIITNFAGTGANYSFTLTPAEGQVSVQIAAGACTDLAGYSVPASNQFKRVLDSNAPTIAQVTSPAIGLAGFSNAQVPVRVVFSEPMTGFATTDLRIEGATVSAFAAQPGNSEFTFTVWPLTTSATRAVRLIVPAASANDTATNISAASSMITFNYNSASAAFVSN
jgi:hypothetical protein